MSEPQPERSSRVVRQLRHDVDDVYELLTAVHEGLDQRITSVHEGLDQRITGLDQRITSVHDGLSVQMTDLRDEVRQQGTRLDGLEQGQREILDLLRDGRS